MERYGIPINKSLESIFDPLYKANYLSYSIFIQTKRENLFLPFSISSGNIILVVIDPN